MNVMISFSLTNSRNSTFSDFQLLFLFRRLPDFFVKPDLGPKMYNAYGESSFLLQRFTCVLSESKTVLDLSKN